MKFIDVLKSREGRPIDFVTIEPKIAKLAKKFNLSLIYIFGSYASNSAGKLSDVDTAVLGKKNLTPDEIIAIISSLVDIFEDEAIDLVDLNVAPLTLIHRVLKEGRCLFASSLRAKIEFETRYEGFYLDTKHLRDEYLRALERRLLNGTFGGI